MLIAAICATVVIVFVVLWAAAVLNGQTVGRPEESTTRTEEQTQ